MMIPKRLLVLAGCTLILAACAQDTTTAPPVTTDVGIEAVTGYGSEGGTITFTKSVSGGTDYCQVKYALNNLWTGGAADNFRLYLRKSGYATTDWEAVIFTADVSRNGTYRATVAAQVSKTILQEDGLFLGRYTGGSRLFYEGIGWFFLDSTDEWEWAYASPASASRFKVVNRCF